MPYQRKTALILTSLITSITLALSGCREAPPSPKSLPQVGVFIVKAQKIPVTTELPGRTSPFLIAEVRPQVGGIILKRLFTEGADVKAGQTLYQIDAALYKAAFDSATANLAKAEANLTTLKLKADRYRELLKINAVSKQDYDDADAAFKQAQADGAANKAALESARINLDYTRITSPISGRTGISTVTPGALVTTNQTTALTTVQQLDPIYVDVTQSSADLLRLKHELENGLLKRTGTNSVKAKLILDDNSNYALEGELAFSDVTVDQSTGTVTLRAIFPNPKHDLLPGMFVRAVLEEGVNEDGILVPQQGVTHNARGNATALVLTKEGKVELRTLTLGEAIGNKWVVRSGLKVGDQLIVDGLQKIKPGASAQVAQSAAPASKQ
jgi:membrane fusion protein (multidrug efflux system)